MAWFAHSVEKEVEVCGEQRRGMGGSQDWAARFSFNCSLPTPPIDFELADNESVRKKQANWALLCRVQRMGRGQSPGASFSQRAAGREVRVRRKGAGGRDCHEV